jgi:hypothetical protein
MAADCPVLRGNCELGSAFEVIAIRFGLNALLWPIARLSNLVSSVLSVCSICNMVLSFL